MAKKLTLIGMALAAVAAFVVPAAASAAPVMTSSAAKGVPLTVNTTIKGTSTNAVTTNTPLGELTCDHVEIYGKITKNNKTEGAAGVGIGGATTECESDEWGGIQITNPTLKTLSSTTSGVANISMTYEAHIGPVLCHFEGTGTGTYATNSDLLKIQGLKLKAASPLCEEDQEITFHGDFTLTLTNGTPVEMSAG